MTRFHKYQALGNDYLVIEGAELTPAEVRRLCDRHFGLGADGVLLPAQPQAGAPFGLRIFNPDGSEAEKSGNGLRIFARYLWDRGLAGDEPFRVLTQGGAVECQVRDAGRQVFVEMGQATFDSARIPVAGPRREVLGETLEVNGERITFTAVGLGNPHCVVHVGEATPALAQALGPLIERHALFPRRSNVQFVQVLDAGHLRLEIWERGAGYTLASGSSSCAAAAASVRLGLCAQAVTAVMPGGSLEIGVRADWSVSLFGAVRKVAEGSIAPEMFEDARGRHA